MATRLYVGGLGERVTEEDLHKTFSHLGFIDLVDIIRTKNRSFAYINFLPSSDNSLPKLFSTYNGCLWKGGKLKLEKAKEHYTDRLKREWAEDAELINSEDTNHNDVDENMVASLGPKSSLDFEKMQQLKMFFPKLRKVKSLPFRGTGKHKYSFQRVAVPLLPVHFCDCPEHSDDLQNGKINGKESNTVTSVMNSALNKGPLKNRCIKPPRGAQVDDSRIQDDGMNDEEIHVMNSVMKKLFERETAKNEPKNLHHIPQQTASTFEVQEKNDIMDEETDDDDIKINLGTGQDFGSESWVTSLVNKMASSNEQTDEPAKSELGTQNIKSKSSIKKRKSVFNDSNEKDTVSHVPQKKVHFQTQSKESEHLELKIVTESLTKKSNTSGMWTQKSPWKELVGDSSSGSFHFSLGVTNNDEQPISVGETSSESKKQKSASNDVHEELKSSNKTPSDKREPKKVSNSVHQNLDFHPKDSNELQSAQLEAVPNEGLEEVSRGSTWMQKSPWSRLVCSGEGSSFSFSQILSKDQLEKQKLNKSNNSTSLNNFYVSGAGFGGTRNSRSVLAGDKKKDARASKGNVNSDSTISKKSDLEQVSNSLPEVVISDTCPFMRNADSLKEWQSAKTALTGALKKRNNSKQGGSL